MIIDTLRSIENYYNLYPGIKEALTFLVDAVTSNKANGRYEFDGGKSYASIGNEKGIGQGNGRLETHRKYIDIQFCLEGTDYIGWSPAGENLSVSQPYDSKKDVEFYSDTPLEEFSLSGNTFCIFFPEDAHAPLSGTEDLRKMVIKLRVTYGQGDRE